MRAALVWLTVAVASLVLAGGFLRALPAVVERQRAGQDAALRAVCGPALRPTAGNPALGQLAASPDGVAAPDFTLKDWAGNAIQLSALRGRVVLVNFWATWCDTCVVEMPSLEQLAQSQRGKDFSLLAISVDESWEPVRQFFAAGTKLTVLLDPEKSVPPRWGTDKFPESFLIDRDGRIRYYVVSDRNWAAPEVKACIDLMLRS